MYVHLVLKAGSQWSFSPASKVYNSHVPQDSVGNQKLDGGGNGVMSKFAIKGIVVPQIFF